MLSWYTELEAAVVKIKLVEDNLIIIQSNTSVSITRFLLLLVAVVFSKVHHMMYSNLP